jgi:hypothetical protein
MRITLRVLVIPLAVAASLLAGGSSGTHEPGSRHLALSTWRAGMPPPLDTMGRPDSSRDSSMRDTTWRDTVPDTLPKPKPKPKPQRPPRKPR